MLVPIKPCRVKGGSNDVSLDVYPKMRKKVVFSPPLFVLGAAAFLCQPASVSHKHPTLINSPCLPLCLTMKSFYKETKEPELQ